MNEEKLKKMQSQVRIGGKGTPRRKKKIMHSKQDADGRKLQFGLKKLQMTTLTAIDEVNMFRDDNTVIHFNNPRVQASLAANTYAVTGNAQEKRVVDLMPGVLEQLSSDKLKQLKDKYGPISQFFTDNDGDDDDEVPELVADYDEAADAAEVAKVQVVYEEKPKENN